MLQERRGESRIILLTGSQNQQNIPQQVVIWELLQQDDAHDAIVARPVEEVDNEADVSCTCVPA